MKNHSETEFQTAMRELLEYYPTKKEMIKALDEILYALFCIDSEMMQSIDIHNCAFTIRKLKNVILAEEEK